jgi:hypothetical protein
MDTMEKARRVADLVKIVEAGDAAADELMALLPPDDIEPDECEPEPVGTPDDPKLVVEHPGQSVFAPATGCPVKVPLECCGSMGAKHKRDCPVRHPGRVQQTNRAPKIDANWKCVDCGHQFASVAAKLDVTCPDCGGIHVVEA